MCSVLGCLAFLFQIHGILVPIMKIIIIISTCFPLSLLYFQLELINFRVHLLYPLATPGTTAATTGDRKTVANGEVGTESMDFN